MTVRVFDADMGSDDPLGTSMFSLKRLRYNESVGVDLELKGDGGGGVLQTIMTLLPFDESLVVPEPSEDSTEDMDVPLLENIDEFIRDTFGLRQAEERSGIDLSDLPTAWKALAVVAGKKPEEAFDPVCFIENEETNTQVRKEDKPSSQDFQIVVGVDL